MLEQDINQIDTTSTDVAVVNNTSVAKPVVAGFQSSYTKLNGAFAEMGIDLPSEATTGCTVLNGSIKFGDNMQHDCGDYLVINPFNFSVYQKVNLGIPHPSADEKKLCLNCKDGQTVTLDEVQYTKEEYLNLLKKKGFPKAKFEDRAVIHGQYIDSERNAKVGEHVADDDIFAIYLSPSSLRAYNAFLMKAALSNAHGHLKLTKLAKSYKGVNWTQFDFSSVPAVERN